MTDAGDKPDDFLLDSMTVACTRCNVLQEETKGLSLKYVEVLSRVWSSDYYGIPSELCGRQCDTTSVVTDAIVFQEPIHCIA